MDSDFASTRYGQLRVAHFILCISCLIMEEVSNCWSRNYGFLESVSVYGLIFSILVLVMFCVQFHHTLENYINLPLTLMLNEIIICIFFIVAGISVLANLCGGAAKLGSILTGILGIITGVTFGLSAKLSYDWFATGSQALTI